MTHDVVGGSGGVHQVVFVPTQSEYLIRKLIFNSHSTVLKNNVVLPKNGVSDQISLIKLEVWGKQHILLLNLSFES